MIITSSLPLPRSTFRLFTTLLFLIAAATLAIAQERPYFVTYSHELEEPGDFEVALKSAGAPTGKAPGFLSNTMELEYGVTPWWTTETYFSGQSTSHDSTVFNGFRLENRFRPLQREHWINPVLYVEFEDINAADKSLLEVVGHDGVDDLRVANADGRADKQREMELKLILGSNFKGWNVSENLIFEKNLANDPWEFGYSWGISRPLAFTSKSPCTFCAKNISAGVEMYGGLGDRHSFGLQNTSHYAAPIVALALPSHVTIRFSPAFGLTNTSLSTVYRFGVSYEIEQLISKLRGQK